MSPYRYRRPRRWTLSAGRPGAERVTEDLADVGLLGASFCMSNGVRQACLPDARCLPAWPGLSTISIDWRWTAGICGLVTHKASLCPPEISTANLILVSQACKMHPCRLCAASGQRTYCRATCLAVRPSRKKNPLFSETDVVVPE